MCVYTFSELPQSRVHTHVSQCKKEHARAKHLRAKIYR